MNKTLIFLIFMAMFFSGDARATNADTDALLLKYGSKITDKVGPTLKLLAETWSVDVLKSSIAPSFFDQ